MNPENKLVKNFFSYGFGLCMAIIVFGLLLKSLDVPYAYAVLHASIGVIIVLPALMLFAVMLFYIKRKDYVFALMAASIIMAAGVEFILGASK